MVARIIAGLTGSVLGIAIGVVILGLQALIPGAVISLFSDWSLLHSMIVWVGIEVGVLIASFVVVALIGFAIRD